MTFIPVLLSEGLGGLAAGDFPSPALDVFWRKEEQKTFQSDLPRTRFRAWGRALIPLKTLRKENRIPGNSARCERFFFTRLWTSRKHPVPGQETLSLAEEFHASREYRFDFMESDRAGRGRAASGSHWRHPELGV
jgi:hypothetical protein